MTQTEIPFWNTTGLRSTDLSEAVKTARQQDEAVLAIMRTGTWSPSQVWDYGRSCGRNWLLTSCRRSISNLTKAGALKMTGIQVEGPYGRPENTWTAA